MLILNDRKGDKTIQFSKKKELYELEQHILKQSIKRFDPLDLLLIILFHLWSEYFTLFINFHPLYLHVYSIMPNKYDQLNMLIITTFNKTLSNDLNNTQKRKFLRDGVQVTNKTMPNVLSPKLRPSAKTRHSIYDALSAKSQKMKTRPSSECT